MLETFLKEYGPGVLDILWSVLITIGVLVGFFFVLVLLAKFTAVCLAIGFFAFAVALVHSIRIGL